MSLLMCIPIYIVCRAGSTQLYYVGKVTPFFLFQRATHPLFLCADVFLLLLASAKPYFMSSVQRDLGLFERTRMESLPFLSVRMLTVAFFADGPPPT